MLEKLISKIEQYNPQTDLSLIIKAYHFGDSAHTGQLRNSGEKFFIHPANVALILAELNMDVSKDYNYRPPIKLLMINKEFIEKAIKLKKGDYISIMTVKK